MRNMQVSLPEVFSLTNNILQLMQEAALIFSEEGVIIQANKVAEKIIGFNDFDYCDVLFSTLFASLDKFEMISKELQCHQYYCGSHMFIHNNGERYEAKLKISEISITGHLLYFVIFDNHTLQSREEAERALAEKIFMNIEESVLYTDKRGVILSVNPAFQIVTGYTEEEALGERPNILQSGYHKKDFYETMWKEISEKGRWSGEIWNKRKNGEVFPEWLTIHAIVDDSGEVTNHVALFSDITDRKHKENQLQKLTRYDALTGTANRSSLNEELSTLMKTSQKYGQILAVLHLDLDRFKVINETLGHEYGDLLLKKVAARIKRMLKSKDVLARFGGDEFIIVLPNLKHVKEAVHISQDIILALKQPFHLYDQEAYTSASIGIGLYPFDGLQVETLLINAEKALNEAKTKGVNGFELYHEELTGNDSRRRTIENKLHTAVENNELQVHYHPQVNLVSGEVVGVEALLRWNEAELGQISPGEFIPIAEETGLIIPISQWVIKKACEDVKNFHISGYPNLKVSINISGLHFTQENFVKDVISLIENTNINPFCVELELTESMIMPNAQDSVRKLVTLKQHGLKLSIDDFGTGYSSLSYLNKFPIDTLKIDQSFIKNSSNYKDDSAIVIAIITMAKTLNLEVIAEGVELKKHVDFLKRQKCDIIQGFYLSKPLPVSDLQEFLEMWEPSFINGKKVHDE
ncbi:EAL domain-containing protein [Peribacillus sp. NPDC097675]|uniref:putative bifunctional diguanylate cyclase/phosphodiesterase n=1 Tax=Peribacillus sp. NPDC097675 TaxID=3390618 RepID=UPI003D042B8A